MRQHSLRLPDDLADAIDRLRGLVPRNAWIVETLKRRVAEETQPKERKPPVEKRRRD